MSTLAPESESRVENVREGGRHVQRVIKALGRRDEVENSALLDGLIASAARHCHRSIVLSSFYRGELPELRRRSIGPDLVFGRLWQETGCRDVLRGMLDDRHVGFDVERAVYLTVLHRLLVSGSDRHAHDWRQRLRIPGAEALTLDQAYKAMAWHARRRSRRAWRRWPGRWGSDAPLCQGRGRIASQPLFQNGSRRAEAVASDDAGKPPGRVLNPLWNTGPARPGSSPQQSRNCAQLLLAPRRAARRASPDAFASASATSRRADMVCQRGGRRSCSAARFSAASASRPASQPSPSRALWLISAASLDCRARSSVVAALAAPTSSWIAGA